MDNTKCTICGKEIPRHLLKKGKKTCSQACALKLYYQNPENRKKTADATKNALNREETRLKHSNTMKKKWQNEEYKQSQKEAIAKGWSDVTKKQAQSDKLKQIRSNKELSNKTSIGLKKYFAKLENRQKQSEKLIEVYKNPEVRKNVSIAVAKALAKPEIKAKQKAGLSRVIGTSKVQAKINATKKQNHTFNSSKTEQYVKELLQQKFDMIEYQYRSEQYPFNCDFYIPSLDLYIELNFHWTHGGRPFDENDESCIEQLNVRQEKAKLSKFYQNAIKTWVVRDIKKRQCAISNKLNWLCFYSFEELESWLNKGIILL